MPLPVALRSSRLLLVVFVLGGAGFAACGDHGESVFDDPGQSSGTSGASGTTSGDFGKGDASSALKVTKLVFDPPKQVLTADGITPQSATYRLRATLANGTSIDVAPQSLQFDRPDLAAAKSGSPVALTTSGAYGGTGKLHGIYGGVEAVAELTVKVVRRDLGAGVTPTIAAALDAAGLAADPSLTTLRYPYDKTVFPLGLTSPLVMWDAPAANDVYKLHLEEASYQYDTYAAVSALGQLRVNQAIWDRVTASNAGPSDPLKVTLSRYSATNQTAYASTSASWTIAPASLRGAIYYWTASLLNGVRQGHIARIRPGSGSVPEALSTGQTSQCMGCHAVSADGSTLAASVDAAPTGKPATYAYTNGWSEGRGWASFDLPSGTVRKQTAMNGGNLALTPDGKYAVFGGRNQSNVQAAQNQWQPGSKYMTLADTKTGTVVTNSGLDDVVLANATVGLAMPAFAPDGTKLAAVEFNGNLRDNVLPDSTGILVFGFDRANLKFAATPNRLPVGSYAPYATTGIGYPSFTPSSKFVAFHVGNESTGCFKDPGAGNCDDNVRHRGAIWYQATDGAGAAVRLAAMDDPPATADRDVSVEPTFNPVERGNYSWAVFTSMRDWGNKLTGAAINGKRRLWVAAIDVTTGAADPSHPPFYLEGQEDSPNMRGFWTLAACTPTPKPGAGGGTCQANFECCSGFCDQGVCVEPQTLACVGLGEDCKTTADCCNSQSVSCIGGKCTAKRVN